jgi:hypothetical protein
MLCFRKSDGSSWRIWNTGCGWEIGLKIPASTAGMPDLWERYARYYSGQCTEIPQAQRGVDALTTSVFFDGFGALISGIQTR